MQYSIATVCLSGLLVEKIPAIARAGFTGVEIFENDILTYDGSIAQLRELIESHGLQIVAYQPFRDFEGLPEPWRSRAFERARYKLDLSAELGCDLLMICSSLSTQALDGIDRAAGDLAELGELAAQRGVRLAYEALGWGRFINDYRDSWEVVRRADHASVGLCLDTFHIFSRETPLNVIESIPGDRIFLVQVADAPRMSLDTLSWSRHYRCFPGQGELPLDEFMNRLAATGYNGPLSLEVFNDHFRAGDTEETAKDGYRSLVYLGEHTQNSCGDRAPRVQKSLLRPQIPGNVAFIEFAIAPEKITSFYTLLSALGFVRAARHRSKAVEHWRQGNINLVINLEEGSYAAQYLSLHGSSVCAIALEVSDVEKVIERAAQMNYQASYGDPLNDTHGNPAIAGLSEGLLYFVPGNGQSIWQRDFIAEVTTDESGLLEHVDHMSFTMPYPEMLRSILLYRAVLGMSAAPAVDVYDPGGLMRSQVMRTDDNAVCFALNSSDAENTLSSRILERQAGPGVQHIALESRDIKALARRVRDAGIPILTLPDNYYADLQARFGLSDADIAELAELGLLYDEDESGKFWQFYTRMFDGSFCFEIVQRQGYTGFGAANAPIRSAMQAIELAAAGA